MKESSEEEQFARFTMDVLHDPDGSMAAMVHGLVKEVAGEADAEEICLRDGYEMREPEKGQWKREAEEAGNRNMQEEEEKLRKRLRLQKRGNSLLKRRGQWRRLVRESSGETEREERRSIIEKERKEKRERKEKKRRAKRGRR